MPQTASALWSDVLKKEEFRLEGRDAKEVAINIRDDLKSKGKGCSASVRELKQLVGQAINEGLLVPIHPGKFYHLVGRREKLHPGTIIAFRTLNALEREELQEKMVARAEKEREQEGRRAIGKVRTLNKRSFNKHRIIRPMPNPLYRAA